MPKWRNLPAELRERGQWLLAGPDATGAKKVPTSVDAAGNLCPGSSTNMATWLSFDTAVAAARHYGYGLGFVLSAADPFTCIDLDVKNASNAPNNPEKWTSQEDIERFQSMMETFDSYTELSQSGQGLHIWVYGNIGEGKKRQGVEVYSRDRFMACTGNTVLPLPIGERQALLDYMVTQLVPAKDTSADLVEIHSALEDMDILERLGSQENGAKFNALCVGDWAGMGYPSQSEADLALMSMFCFYSPSNEQCKRLFRMSGLGKRDKAVKNDVYLNRTLGIIRGRISRELAVEEHGEQVSSALIQSFLAQQPAQALQAAPPAVCIGEGVAPVQSAPPQGAEPYSLNYPPGVVGEVARYIFHSSPRPVKEVGIIAALGLFAGMCGRAYQIPGSGLNMYMILVARSAVGKEAMHSGLSSIIAQCCMVNQPMAARFVDFTDYASGPALVKAVTANRSFLNVSGEWGRKLKRLAQEDSRADGPMAGLRTAMLNLYQKSSIDSIVGGLGYSDKEKSVASVSGVAYSMIGETTPGTFFDALTESMMEDGFLSRFTVIEYDGKRPEANPNPKPEMDPYLLQYVGSMFATCARIVDTSDKIYVLRSDEALQMLDAFDKECDTQINSTTDESWRQMWNRAHLKVCRVAALLAAGDNNNFPVIQPNHVEWALNLIRRDIAIMSRRMEGGDIGVGDTSREKKLLACLQEYAQHGAGEGYKVPAALHKDGIIPRKYLQIRVQRVSSFNAHRQGFSFALDSSIKSLVASGYLLEVPREKLVEKHQFHGQAWRIVSL